MTSALDNAKRAREQARKLSPHDIRIYSAWRAVTYWEKQLTADEFDAYQEWAQR